MTKEQLKSEISEMEAVLNDASTPADTKEVLREAVKNAKEQLREMEQQEEAQKKEEKKLEAKAESIEKDMTKAKTPEAKKKLSGTLQKAKQQLSKKKEEGKQKKKKSESKLSQQVAKAKGILKKASAKSQKFNAGRSQDNLERDSKRKAKPIGWRTSAEGNRYWEGRANRSDVDRRKMPYLELGGIISEYNQTFSLPKGGKNNTIWQSHTDSELRKAGQQLFSAMPYSEHLSRAKHFSEKAADILDNYTEYVSTQFEKEFGREIQPTDYKVSGIWTDEFSNYAKDKLRSLLDDYNKSISITRFHNAFLKNQDKQKDKFEDGGLINPVDADPLKIASDLYANGGRIKSAVNRDRAYKSEEPWEQDYNRKTKPKNPKYRYEHGGELQSVAENITVFGYQTENFNLCPKAVEQFEKAINVFELERDTESGYWKIQTESLSMCAKNADAIIGLHQRAAKGETIDAVDVKLMVNSLQYFAIFNYKSGLKINGEFLVAHVEGMFSHKIKFEFGGAVLPLTNGTLSDPRFNIDSSQFYEAGGNILNEDTVGRVENIALADPAAYEDGGIITNEQHNKLSLASDITIETKQTGSGHWDVIGYFMTDEGEVIVRASTTDSEMVDAINDKNENTERIEEATQQAINVLLNRGIIVNIEDLEYAKGGRISEMVNHWNKYGWAGSSTDNDDSEFFKMIGRTQFDTPVTSFTGNDVKYYDDERVMPVNGGFRKYAKGGKVGFDDKVKAISGNLEGKKVKPKYQRKYGKRYSHKEAVEAARNIAGSMRKKEMK